MTHYNPATPDDLVFGWADTDPDWTQAACRNTPIDYFWNRSASGRPRQDGTSRMDSEHNPAATLICAKCPIRLECLKWALDNILYHQTGTANNGRVLGTGIWGGATTQQRYKIHTNNYWPHSLEHWIATGCDCTNCQQALHDYTRPYPNARHNYETTQTALQLYRQGIPYKEIQQLTGIKNIENYIDRANNNRIPIKKRRPHVKRHNRQGLITMYVHNHLTCEQIAKKLGCSQVTVNRMLHEHGIPLRGDFGSKRLADTTIQQIITLRKQGYSYNRIADELNISKKACINYCKKAGINKNDYPLQPNPKRKKSGNPGLPRQTREQIVTLRQAGLTHTQIANQLIVSVSAVARYCKKANVSEASL